MLSRKTYIKRDEDHWIPLSDLMTGLMMIFMLVAILFMIQVKRNEAKAVETKNKAASLASTYTDLRAQLYSDLANEFKNDFEIWHASINPDLTVRFEEPSVQFDTGQWTVKPEFASILDSFFPRYVGILSSSKYKDAIEEVRIEGHTSSIWRGKTPEEAYYENMKLSQERTRSVLRYVFSLPELRGQLGWLLPLTTANGLSSAKRLVLENGAEDIVGSQRVEFRVRTNAERRLADILKALSE